jgi:hypothetical protein
MPWDSKVLNAVEYLNWEKMVERLWFIWTGVGLTTDGCSITFRMFSSCSQLKTSGPAVRRRHPSCSWQGMALGGPEFPALASWDSLLRWCMNRNKTLSHAELLRGWHAFRHSTDLKVTLGALDRSC